MTPDIASDWNLLHHELMVPVTTIAGRTQLLQRQVLRANGLTTLDRDLLLGNLATVLDAAWVVRDRLAAVIASDDPHSGQPAHETPH